MKRLALSFAVISMLVTGCAATAPQRVSAPAAAAEDASHEAPKQAAREAESPAPEAPIAASAEPGRAPGDYVVYRFTGSFRQKPATLTERVVDRTGDDIRVELALDDGSHKERLLVTMSDAPASRGDVRAVERFEGSALVAGTGDDYEALLAQVTLAADQNEALVGTTEGAVNVAGSALPCRTSEYRVRVGKSHATMRTIGSDEFLWGDVGAEIVTSAGRVLYRAEVVAMGREHASGALAEASEPATYEE